MSDQRNSPNDNGNHSPLRPNPREQLLAELKSVPQIPAAWLKIRHKISVYLASEYSNLNPADREDAESAAILELIPRIEKVRSLAYIYDVAEQKANDLYNAKVKRPTIAFEDNMHDPQSEEAFYQAAGREGDVDLMREALSMLPLSDHEFIVAYAKFTEAHPECEHFSREFGKTVGLTAVNVRRKLGRIRAQLRKHLDLLKSQDRNGWQRSQ